MAEKSFEAQDESYWEIINARKKLKTEKSTNNASKSSDNSAQQLRPNPFAAAFAEARREIEEEKQKIETVLQDYTATEEHLDIKNVKGNSTGNNIRKFLTVANLQTFSATDATQFKKLPISMQESLVRSEDIRQMKIAESTRRSYDSALNSLVRIVPEIELIVPIDNLFKMKAVFQLFFECHAKKAKETGDSEETRKPKISTFQTTRASLRDIHKDANRGDEFERILYSQSFKDYWKGVKNSCSNVKVDKWKITWKQLVGMSRSYKESIAKFCDKSGNTKQIRIGNLNDLRSAITTVRGAMLFNFAFCGVRRKEEFTKVRVENVTREVLDGEAYYVVKVLCAKNDSNKFGQQCVLPLYDDLKVGFNHLLYFESELYTIATERFSCAPMKTDDGENRYLAWGINVKKEIVRASYAMITRDIKNGIEERCRDEEGNLVKYYQHTGVGLAPPSIRASGADFLNKRDAEVTVSQGSWRSKKMAEWVYAPLAQEKLTKSMIGIKKAVQAEAQAAKVWANFTANMQISRFQTVLKNIMLLKCGSVEFKTKFAVKILNDDKWNRFRKSVRMTGNDTHTDWVNSAQRTLETF